VKGNVAVQINRQITPVGRWSSADKRMVRENERVSTKRRDHHSQISFDRCEALSVVDGGWGARREQPQTAIRTILKYRTIDLWTPKERQDLLKGEGFNRGSGPESRIDKRDDPRIIKDRRRR
jgi:hypothetical protein